MLGPSLSTLLCRCDPIPLRSTVSGRFNPSSFGGTRARPSLSYLRCWGHPSPRYCVGAIPSLSALRYRDVSIPLRSAVLGRDHPSPICGAGAIPLHATVSVRSHPSPLYGIGTIPSPLRSAVLGRDHPSPVCGAGAIPLHAAVSVRSHPSPLYGIGTIPSLSVRRY